MSYGWSLLLALHLIVGLAVYVWAFRRERCDESKVLERPAAIASQFGFTIVLFLILWPIWLLIFLCRKRPK